MITAHKQGAFAGWNQMLMALVCLKTQLASDLMSQMIDKAREAPSLSSFPVVDSRAEETFNLIEDLLHNLREEASVSWQTLDVPGSPAAAAISWLIKHAADGRVGCTWLEAHIASRPSPEERRPLPAVTSDEDEDVPARIMRLRTMLDRVPEDPSLASWAGDYGPDLVEEESDGF